MGERFRMHAPGRHPLQPIVSHRGRRAEAGFHIAGVNDIALGRRVTPDPGETVGLQFQTDRERVSLGGVRHLPSPDTSFDAENLLNVMSDFMRDHVRLRELTGGSEALAQFVEEAEIEIHFFVLGTIEGPGRRLGGSAVGIGDVAKQDQLGVTIGGSVLGKYPIPGLLRVIEYK